MDVCFFSTWLGLCSFVGSSFFVWCTFISGVHLWQVVVINIICSNWYIPFSFPIKFCFSNPHAPSWSYSLRTFILLRCSFKHKHVPQTSAFVKLTHESTLAPAWLSDLASTSRADIYGSAIGQPLASSLSQSCTRHCHWQDLSEHDYARQQKLLTEDSPRLLEVVSDLIVTVDPSCSAFADVIFHDHISPWQLSSARVDALSDVGSTPNVRACVSRVTAPPFSALEHSACLLPSVSGVHAVPSLSLVAWPGAPPRSGLRVLVHRTVHIFDQSRSTSRASGIGWKVNDSQLYQVCGAIAGVVGRLV